LQGSETFYKKVPGYYCFESASISLDRVISPLAAKLSANNPDNFDAWKFERSTDEDTDFGYPESASLRAQTPVLIHHWGSAHHAYPEF
jgi:hypothetical protein